MATFKTPDAAGIKEVQFMKTNFNPKFKVGDKVYWRSNSAGKCFLKSGRIVAVVPAHKKMWEIVQIEDLNNSKFYISYKLMLKRSNPPREHESYIVAVTYSERWKAAHRLATLYWPKVYKLKPDNRQPIPAMFLPEDE